MKEQEIFFNRTKALNYHLIDFAANNVILMMIFVVLPLWFLQDLANYIVMKDIELWKIAFGIIVGRNVYSLIKCWIIIRKLRYWFHPHSLTQEHYFIGRTRDKAKLQVVNNIYVEQDWINRLLGLYSVTVNYGFSDEGYSFAYNYLSKETADMISNKIKPTGSIWSVDIK